MTKNPSYLASYLRFQHIQDNVRTFVFAVDVSSYLDESKTIVDYAVGIIKDFLKQIK